LKLAKEIGEQMVGCEEVASLSLRFDTHPPTELQILELRYKVKQLNDHLEKLCKRIDEEGEHDCAQSIRRTLQERMAWLDECFPEPSIN
jgi:hypothetical protein